MQQAVSPGVGRTDGGDTPTHWRLERADHRVGPETVARPARNFGRNESLGRRKCWYSKLNFWTDMKKGWEIKKLLDVVDFQRGLTYSKNDEVDFSEIAGKNKFKKSFNC